MNPTRCIPIEPGNRIQLPTEWATALGLQGQVTLERTTQGILIRPSPPLTWDEIFATGLQVGSAPPDDHPEDVEVTGDDFLF